MSYTPRYSRYQALISGRARGFGPAVMRGGLAVLSYPYGWAMWLRNRAYDRGWKRTHRAAVPVVSVGNLTLGGTGKTPCVEYVARCYRQMDLRVAVLSRGYGGDGGRNDEALVLEENLPDVPHLQGPDRAALAAIAVEELETEVLVLDDGFQHRRLARDLDLVLLDATNPWGYGRLFPRGLLREPPSSLRRAGVVILTRCDQVSAEEQDRLRQRVARLAPDVPVVETTHQPVALVNSEQAEAPPERLRGQPVAAFCGLGNPEAFRRTVTDLGAELIAFHSYPDHHRYTRADVEELTRWVERLPGECAAVTTQKDLVKLRLKRLGSRDLFAVRIALHVARGQDLLDRALQAVVERRFAEASDK